MTMTTSAPFEESPITYEELGDLEREFQDAEAETMRYQAKIMRPLYQKRHAMVSQIANFWPLVFEQAPPDIDEYMHPSDQDLLLSSLVSLTVRQFELEGDDNDANASTAQDPAEGDPRSVAIRFEFAENDHFTDRVLEKRFYHRRTCDGWSGLVSEPVDIHWRSHEKDLTGGLLGLVNRAWRLENGSKSWPKDGAAFVELNQAKRELQERVETTPLGGLSFFAWFGYRGPPVTAEEHQLGLERDRKRRAGETLEPLPAPDVDYYEEWEKKYEIFPTGDDLAIAITEDLWPNALDYFTQAQEQAAMSDDDFESDDDGDTDEDAPVSNGAQQRKA